MATTLQLKQGDSGTTLTLNSNGSTGFRLEENGWNPAIANPVYMGDPPPVLERFDLLLTQINYNNLASSMQSLHEMQVIADRYMNDRTQENPVWLHAQMDGETNQRRALVRNIDIQYAPSWFGAGQTTTNIPLVVTIEREPYWESTTARDFPDSGNKSGACVVYDYTAAGASVSAHDIVGDVGARIRFFSMDDAASDNYKFWMGIRSANKHGSTGLSNFEEIWECENGINNASETGVTDEVDATASGGNMVEVTEIDLQWDDTWQEVCFIELDDVTLNEEDQLGNFLWLLRAKVDSGTWEVQLKYGSGGSPILPYEHISTDIVEIDKTNWNNYTMGIFPLYPRNLHAIRDDDVPTAYEFEFNIQIYARRTSGSGDLNVDCLIPIPIDEGFIYFDNISRSDDKAFGQAPEGVWAAIGGNVSSYIDRVLPEPASVNNFNLPPGDGRMYCVYETYSAGSDITDVMVFNDSDEGKYYERWLSLRGSE